MLTDEQGVKLHHRLVLGETLTAAEKAALDTWYAYQDELERQTLNLTHREDSLEALRQNLHAALADLVTEAQKLQQSELENERLRQEVEALKRHLSDVLLPKAA